MAGIGAKKGHPKWGGRKKGSCNKATKDAREAFRMVYEERLVDLNRWLTELAEGIECVHFLADGTECKYIERNPGKAAELLLRMAEHFIPKLERIEHTGPGGERMTVSIVIDGKKMTE